MYIVIVLYRTERNLSSFSSLTALSFLMIIATKLAGNNIKWGQSQ